LKLTKMVSRSARRILRTLRSRLASFSIAHPLLMSRG
jgi:hypothetical protein